MTFPWAQICSSPFLPSAAGNPIMVVVAMGLAGLGGSLTHCLGMCSGFVLAQMPAQSSRLARLLLPYHFGRIVTYGALGAIAGAGFSLLPRSAAFDLFRHLILAGVAAVFLWVMAERFLTRLGLRLPFRIHSPLLSRLSGGACALRGLNRLTQVRGPVARFGLGMSLGLLPCPLVMAATLSAAATANPFTGAAAMTAFGIGTAPVLIAVGFARSNLLKASPGVQDILSLVALGLNGVILLTLAAS